MGATPLIQNRSDFSLEEYYSFQDAIATTGLIIDDEPIQRVEFYNGKIWFMSGGTIRHAQICRNATISLGNILKGSKCQPFDSNVNLAVDRLRSIFHPDLLIACDGIEKSRFDKNGITNAAVIFEVLSKSTEGYDRGEKFRKYKQIPAFKEYVLINQDKPLVETLVKHEGDLWAMHYFEGLESCLKVESLGIEIPLSEIYAGVDFEEEKEDHSAF